MTKRTVSSLSIILLLGLASITFAFKGKPPQLPAPYHTPSASNAPKIIPRPDGAQLSLPKGFTAELYADGFEKPRFMALGPGGEVLISDSADKGTVYILQDRDKDGKAESKEKLLEGLYRPYGLAFWKDFLYVAETTSLKRYKYNASATKVEGPGEEVVSMKDFTKAHWTRTVLFDRKGEKMYLAIGSGSNVDAGDDPKRAAINRYNPDGTGHEIVASGLRNPVALRWYPGTDTLWATVQERDGLGDDLVPDFFTSVRPGAFYGWPYAYIGPNEEPRRKGENPELVKKAVVPDVVLGAHKSVLDALFYTGRQFPKEYQGGAFIAYRGSSNRAKRTGYSVVFIPFKKSKPAGEPRDFLTGFMLGPDQREVWGRPVGLLQMPDGSLLVSEDGGNKVWRISFKG